MTITNCNTDGTGTFATAWRDPRASFPYFIVSSFSISSREANNDGRFRHAFWRETENRKSRFAKMLSRSIKTGLFENVEIAMTIYTAGGAVTLEAARLVDVWVEKTAGRIKWHYSEKKPTRQTHAIEKMGVWHFKARYIDSGNMMCDGQEVEIHRFKADGGWQEIAAECKRLNPADTEREGTTYELVYKKAA